MMSHPPIPIHELAEHIELLKANDNLRLSQEYEVSIICCFCYEAAGDMIPLTGPSHSLLIKSIAGSLFSPPSSMVNCLFAASLQSIDPSQQFTWEHSNLEVNKPKNRYANVIAYDHTRVILAPIEGELHE